MAILSVVNAILGIVFPATSLDYYKSLQAATSLNYYKSLQAAHLSKDLQVLKT